VNTTPTNVSNNTEIRGAGSTESLNTSSNSEQPTQAANDPFGDWQLRQSNASNGARPTSRDNDSFRNVEKKEFNAFNDNNNISSDDDSLDTPPFFKRRGK
ncbi:cell division protein FtsZ, partial [Lacticaseibacillus paracasei]